MQLKTAFRTDTIPSRCQQCAIIKTEKMCTVIQVVEWSREGTGNDVSNPTLNRLFLIYFPLPLVLIIIIILHYTDDE